MSYFQLGNHNIKEIVVPAIIPDLDSYFPATFKDPEYWDLVGSSPAAFTFSPPSKVTFINFNLTGKPFVFSSERDDDLPDELIQAIGCIVGQSSFYDAFLTDVSSSNNFITKRIF